jgi:uncharacterized membrane protein
MNIPTSQPIPEDNEPLSPARRRRERRLPIPPAGASKDERAAYLDQLAERAIPSFDYYLFSLLAGLVMGVGLLLDSPALIVLGAVLSPLAGPYLGLGLACIAGSGRFFIQSFAAAVIGAMLAFIGGYAAGYASRFATGITVGLSQASAVVQFSWPALVALTLGVVITTFAFAKSSQKATLTGIVLTFLLFPPVAATGFGISAGIPGLLPDGLIVFAVYLAWATILGALTLGLLGLRPLSGFGFVLGGAIAIASLAVLVGLGGVELARQARTTPTALLPVAASPEINQPGTLPATTTSAIDAAPSQAVEPHPTATLVPSPTHTLIPSPTPTITFTPAPTPVWAIVNSESYNGAVIRADPKFGSKILTTILNGTLLEVMPEVATDGGTVWAHVRMTDGKDGWIVQNLLETATPVPGW